MKLFHDYICIAQNYWSALVIVGSKLGAEFDAHDSILLRLCFNKSFQR